MWVGLIGAIIGVVIGVIFGAGPFGWIGGVVGAAIGGVVGFFSLSFFTLAAAGAEASKPHKVTCTVDGADGEVTLGVVSTADAMAGHGHPKVKGCSRWPEHDDCDRGCVRELDLR